MTSHAERLGWEGSPFWLQAPYSVEDAICMLFSVTVFAKVQLRYIYLLHTRMNGVNIGEVTRGKYRDMRYQSYDRFQ